MVTSNENFAWLLYFLQSQLWSRTYPLQIWLHPVPIQRTWKLTWHTWIPILANTLVRSQIGEQNQKFWEMSIPWSLHNWEPQQTNSLCTRNHHAVLHKTGIQDQKAARERIQLERSSNALSRNCTSYLRLARTARERIITIQVPCPAKQTVTCTQSLISDESYTFNQFSPLIRRWPHQIGDFLFDVSMVKI